MNLRGTFSPSLRIASWDESNPQILMRQKRLAKPRESQTNKNQGDFWRSVGFRSEDVSWFSFNLLLV